MINPLLLAWQGNHGGIAPTSNNLDPVGAVPPCQPKTSATAGIISELVLVLTARSRSLYWSWLAFD
jgi:hypothetical protein